VGEGKIYKG